MRPAYQTESGILLPVATHRQILESVLFKNCTIWKNSRLLPQSSSPPEEQEDNSDTPCQTSLRLEPEFLLPFKIPSFWNCRQPLHRHPISSASFPTTVVPEAPSWNLSTGQALPPAAASCTGGWGLPPTSAACCEWVPFC